MLNHRYLAVVILGIVVVLALFLIVGRLNGGDSGGDLEPPTLTPSPSASSPG